MQMLYREEVGSREASTRQKEHGRDLEGSLDSIAGVNLGHNWLLNLGSRQNEFESPTPCSQSRSERLWKNDFAHTSL